MKCCFIYKDEKWKETAEAIKRCFKFKHLDWEICIYKYDKSKCYNECQVVITPLFNEENKSIVPTGLKLIKELRNINSSFISVFFVLFEDEIPDCFNPEKPMSKHAKDIIKNPKFGDTNKAILLAELRYKEDENEKKIINILNLFNCNLKELDKFFSDCKQAHNNKNSDKELLKAYYDTFVRFYDAFGSIDKNGNFDKKLCSFMECIKRNESQLEQLEECEKKWKESSFDLNLIDTQLFLQTADIIYNLLNGIYNLLNGIKRSKADGHRVQLELFRAPIPFPFQELLHARDEIQEALKEDKKIKLLLIDNKWNKLIPEQNDEQILVSLIEKFGLSGMFEIEAIGHPEDYRCKGSDFEIVWDWNKKNFKEEFESAKKKEKEAFSFKEFRENLKKLLKQENTVKNGINYAEIVYNRIKKADFVLLDFFLDEKDTYFAFDFIKDITAIKNKKYDTATVWYFITSAVYASVVKYSQSGVLAEYYESAIINSGDDPKNKKRGIIFIYKLLTFIWARLKEFKNNWKSIENWLKKDCGNISDNYCKKCLHEVMRIAKKFQIEWEELKEIFPKLKESKEEYKSIAESIENLITNFLWLPEADWQIIQLYIEMIDKKLKEAGIDLSLRCSYIKKAIDERSEIY